jgi:hypothetical protein
MLNFLLIFPLLISVVCGQQRQIQIGNQNYQKFNQKLVIFDQSDSCRHFLLLSESVSAMRISRNRKKIFCAFFPSKSKICLTKK